MSLHLGQIEFVFFLSTFWLITHELQDKNDINLVLLMQKLSGYQIKPRAGPGVERIGRTPPPLAQSVETWPIGVRLVCRELRPVSLEERILVIERVGCGRHATRYFGLNFS